MVALGKVIGMEWTKVLTASGYEFIIKHEIKNDKWYLCG
jgi:hypothetical protein